MNIVVAQTGIDVAKNELVVSINQAKPFAVPNTPQGCLDLIARLPQGGTVHLEASGGYERLVRRILVERGFSVAVHNPLKPRRMAQAQGTRAKTDPVDAKVLARSGHLLPQEKLKSNSRQQLADHSRAIDTLKATVAEYKLRLAMPELDPIAREILTASILDLERHIESAEKAFEERIKASDLAQDYKLIQTVPALGKLTARRCLCEFPEDLRERTTGEIASYAGLAPIDNRSGKRSGTAHLGHGNARLKAAFYMPAISAIRSQNWAKELYARLRTKGRPHQTATVAVMRRLLIRAVAILKRGTPWQDEPQKN